MAIYEWRCIGCGRRLERIMTVAELEAGHFCEHCGSQLELVPSRPAWFPSGKYGKAGNQ